MAEAKRKGTRKGRDFLLQAGFALIAHGGLDALTLRGLAQAANCALGTVSYHFANRQELLDAIFAAYVLPHLRLHIKPAYSMNVADGLRDIIKTHLPFSTEAEKIWHVRMNYLTFAAAHPKYRKMLHHARQESENYFTTQFTRLAKAGQLPQTNPKQCAVDFLLLLEGVGVSMLQVNTNARSFYAERLMRWLDAQLHH